MTVMIRWSHLGCEFDPIRSRSVAPNVCYGKWSEAISPFATCSYAFSSMGANVFILSALLQLHFFQDCGGTVARGTYFLPAVPFLTPLFQTVLCLACFFFETGLSLVIST